MSLEGQENGGQSAPAARQAKAPGAARTPAGDERRSAPSPSGTSGFLSGLSGFYAEAEERRLLLRGWLTAVAVLTTVMIINVVTILHDNDEVTLAEPLVWEGSSILVNFVIVLIPWTLARWAIRNRKPLWQLALGAAVLAPVYSLLHVFGFLALRHAAYGAVGETYDYGPLSRAIPYEMSKDVLAFLGAMGLCWLVSRVTAEGDARAAAAAGPAPTFDIRDGAKVIRVALADILAVTSAGNYVEFALADGRKPLMRSALSAIEAELGPQGFVRTHRSWLVNAARVTALTPEGSGDYAVEVGTSVTAPLSRRFPEALARLRGS